MDWDKLLAAVQAEARAAGIPISAQLSPQVVENRRAKTRWGACKRLPDGSFQIELSTRLRAAPEEAVRQTLAHELLHSCPGCMNHGARWREYAAQMVRYGYRISRSDTAESLGVSLPAEPPRYILRCTGCGIRLNRQRCSPVIAHPERYRCRCGGKWVRER